MKVGQPGSDEQTFCAKLRGNRETDSRGLSCCPAAMDTPSCSAIVLITASVAA
jgi:hypothetical protein